MAAPDAVPAFQWATVLHSPLSAVTDAMLLNDGRIAACASYEDHLELADRTFLASVGQSSLVFCLKPAGELDWFIEVKSTETISWNALASNSENEVAAVGVFSGKLSVKQGTESWDFIANGTYDTVVAKIDAKGRIIHCLQLSSSEIIFPRSVEMLGNGYVLLAGYFNGSVDFAPGPYILEIESEGENNDGFLLMLDHEGELVEFAFARSEGAAGFEASHVSENGSIYVAGFMEMDTRIAGSFNINLRQYGHGTDAFILELSPHALSLRDSVVIASIEGSARVYSIESNEDDALFVMGKMQGRVFFDDAQSQLIGDAGVHYGFVTKYERDIFSTYRDRHEWVHLIDGSSIVDDINSAYDAHKEVVWISATFHSSVEITDQQEFSSRGKSDFLVASISESGDLLHASHFGGIDWDNLRSIHVMHGSMLLGGHFASPIDLDASDNVQEFAPLSSSYNGFISLYTDAESEDVSRDEVVDATDLQLVINSVLGFNSIFLADVNRDGSIRVRLRPV